MKKGAKKLAEDEEKKKDGEKWDKRQLAVGNWFSTTSYYKIDQIQGENVICKQDGKLITISRDVVEHEMYNAKVFAKEEKIALTKVVKILREANTTVFTVCFTCKVDEKELQEKLKKANDKDLKNARNLAKDLFVGKEKTIVGRLSKSENHLGRSLIVCFDQHGQPYAQVDHRNIKWLILKNVKYVVV